MQIRQRTIGLFLGSTEDSYGNGLLRGVLEVTRAAEVNLVCFTSGAIKSYHGFEAQKNVLYDLVSSQTVDGLIISGALGHTISQAELLAYCDRFAPIPLVSLSVALPGIPSIVTDNQPGMADLMDHLLTTHRFTRLAFIGGPEGQQEAEVRKAVFVDKLQAHGLTPNPHWLVHGDFTRESGQAAAARLLPAGTPPFEVVVCANDSMALGALSWFNHLGLSVPDDLALTGFDDMDESQFSQPALTTVRQSSFLQAREAAWIILEILDGRSQAAVTNLPPSLVVRQSCGCRYGAPASGAESVPAEYQPEVQFPELTQAFAALTEADEPDRFFVELEHLMTTSLSRDMGTVLQDTLSLLRDEFWRHPPADPELRRRTEDRLHQGRTLVASLTHRAEARHRFRNEVISDRLRETGEALLTSYNLANVLDTLALDLPRMGFTGFWLSLFEDPKNPNSWARLLLGYDHHGRQQLPAEGLRFPSRELLPGGLKTLPPSFSLFILEALYSKEERLGFLLFATDLSGSLVCGSLRSHISGALQGVFLLEERKKAEVQLVQSEKMAALGNLVAGVAHEINTPLGVALTAASYLSDQTRDFHRAATEGHLTRSGLEHHLADNAEATQLILSNLTRAAELVSSFKQVAVDQASEQRRRFFLREYIEEIFLSLRPQWKKHQVEVVVTGPTKLEIDSYPGALAQITTNFLMNALIHAFEPGTSGRIELRLEDQGDDVLYQFSDNGRGIAADNVARIFEPFFTTKRGQGGTGLGLHIIFNLVHNLLGGIVTCTSRLGEGTVFHLRLPKIAPK